MKTTRLILSTLLVCACAAPISHAAPAQKLSLNAARKLFKSRVLVQPGAREPLEAPPSGVFRAVAYPAAPGPLAAYVSSIPRDGKKHPAIIWITGGDCNSIGDVWTPAAPGNDQTAAQFRQAGIVMMFPSLRGGNANPGVKEGFLGEVSDVLAAAQWLEKQPGIDPQRIYLGGHSTGGTLALLVAESSPRFRGVFAFGPVADVSGYGADSGFLPYDVSDASESVVRSPGYWLAWAQSPTWVIEGTEPPANTEALRLMKHLSHNPRLHFIEVHGATHFDLLAPTNALLARKIVADTGARSHLWVSETEVNRNFDR